MKKLLAAWLIGISLPAILIAQDSRGTIAVLDLDPTGISQKDADFLSDRLRTELFETGAFTVVEREKMNDILTEQGFQTSGCTSLECAVEVGKLLNVQLIIAGNIGKIDELYSIGLRMIDIQTGAIVKTATRDYEGKLSEVLVNVIPEIARSLAADQKEKTPAELDSLVTEAVNKYAVVLKFGWGFLTYPNDLNDQIDAFAVSEGGIRLDNFPQHTALSIEGKYLFTRDWRFKIGVSLESMTSSWLNEFDRFQSEIPEIKNLTDITLERKFSFAFISIGIEYIFWQPAEDQDWYVGAAIGNFSMESYIRYAFSQDLIPKSEEQKNRYNKFALQLNAGFNYNLSGSFFLGMELGLQSVGKYDLSSEAKPDNFPPELEPIVFPSEISASGLLLQFAAGYLF